MEQLEARFNQVDVLPMVKHFMDELDLFNLFKKYVPAAADCLADHAESLCVLTANIICNNKPLYMHGYGFMLDETRLRELAAPMPDLCKGFLKDQNK
ncbi:MAG: DUF4277 domain-containing protein [Desulfobacterales bacterium]|nr:DUF4277 domain-containing protein [Desulfobacterales bacterium]